MFSIFDIAGLLCPASSNQPGLFARTFCVRPDESVQKIASQRLWRFIHTNQRRSYPLVMLYLAAWPTGGRQWSEKSFPGEPDWGFRPWDWCPVTVSDLWIGPR
jgi:hypothetical protein